MEKSLRILIIEDEETVCERYKTYISQYDNLVVIATTNSSYEGVELVHKHLPDAVILDLELQYGLGNGLEFLSQLKKNPPSHIPYIVVATNNSSPLTQRYARESGADFIMYKYQKNYSEKSVIDFLRMISPTISEYQPSVLPDTVPITSSDNKNHYIRQIHTELNHVGINPKSIGYQYLTEAILLKIQQQEDITSTIGKKYHKTPLSVTRAMQYAIDRAWSTAAIEDLLLYYTAPIHSKKGVPTILEFVCYYAGKLQIQD